MLKALDRIISDITVNKPYPTGQGSNFTRRD